MFKINTDTLDLIVVNELKRRGIKFNEIPEDRKSQYDDRTYEIIADRVLYNYGKYWQIYQDNKYR